ncbi:MAG: uroporphyrinogen decarboxylase family protein [Kiritimatiellota bacterium]|nr:uroporphyrinogen decarboxylase family protein [Kiritimatiellota bacterium]
MNDRARILALLNGQQPNRVPWLGDLTYWATALEQRGKAPKNFQSLPEYYNWHRELGVGFYLQGYPPYKVIHDDTVKLKREKHGNVTKLTITTPAGELYEETTYMPDSFTSAPTSHLIKEEKDLATLRYLTEHERYEPDYREASRRAELVRDLGVVLCYLPKSPFMQMTVGLAGIETVVGLALDATEEFEMLLECMEAKADEAAAIAIASPAECLMTPENLSSEVVGTHFFEKYMRGFQEKWNKRIKAAGKFSFIHMDGTVRGLLQQEASTGFTILEALTPQPVGDMPWAEMRPLAGPSPILWGGIPGSYFTPIVNDTEFDRHVKEMLELMKRDKRCVLGVADQVPPDALESRVRRVAELADEYGRY